MITDLNKILVEWAYRTNDGKPDVKNNAKLLTLESVLKDFGWSKEARAELLYTLMEQPSDRERLMKQVIKYKNKDGEDKEITVGGALKQGEEHPAYEKAKQITDTGDDKQQSKGLEPDDFERFSDKNKPDDKKEPEEKPKDSGAETQSQEVDRSKFDKKQKIYKDAPNARTQAEGLESLNAGNLDYVNEYQDEVEKNREKGIAGMGGPIASEGESKYCKGASQDLDAWADDNKEKIDEKENEIRDRRKTADEKRTARQLGLKDDDPEFIKYLSEREVWAEEQLAIVKEDKDGVLYKKGKAGFGDAKVGKVKDPEGAYKAWMRVAFDGAKTTQAALRDSDLDTTNEHRVVQSTPELDDVVEAHLEDKAKSAESEEDKKYYKRQLKLFRKFREYHDTFAIGVDKDGRTCIVSISNKKDDQLRDPQNNTTPAQRLRIMKEQMGEEIAENVSKVIDEGVEKVSNAQANTVKKQTEMEITDEVVEACEGGRMSKYMSDLGSKASDERPGRFGDYLKKKGLDFSNMSTKEKLETMKEFSKQKLFDGDGNSRLEEREDGTYYKGDDGEYKKIKNLGQIGLPYEPFGKISIKLGEYEVNEETMGIKQAEKNIVTDTHTEVVGSLFEADADSDGYDPDKRPDADNGPNTQGYIEGVLGSLHINSYIDLDNDDDDKMLIQMGINGVKPSMIRQCTAEQSGFKGDVNTPEGRKELKEHLRKRCRVTPGGEKVSIVNEGKEVELFTDQWRTAGTAQKVASYFGKGMRDCLQGKAAK